MSRVLANKVKNVFYLYKVFFSILAVLFLFFQVSLNKVVGFPTYFDEILLFLILCISVIKAQSDIIIAKLLKLYLLGFVALFLLSLHSISTRGITSVVLQVFIHLKYILFFSFFWMTIGKKHAITCVYFFLAITSLFLVYNLVTGPLFNEVFNLPIQVRAGSHRPVGIQADTASLGSTFAILGALLVSYYKPFSTKFLILTILTVFILFTSVRSALVLIPIVIAWHLKDSLKSFAIVTLFLAVIIVPMKSSQYIDELVDITSQNIEWTVENPVESGYIRGIMIYFSFELANSRFPFGTGAATFGTVTSDDSHIYAEIGMQNSRFFVEKEGIYDSNFASILGEFGYTGLLLYYLLFWTVIRAPFTVGKEAINREFIFIFFLLICAYSIATPVFMNSYPAMLIGLAITGSYKVNRLE